MATDKYIDPALVPRRNSQLGATMQMGVPPPAAKLAIAPRALPQNNPQLAATSGVAGVVPPAAAKLSVAPQRFSSGLPGVQGPAMPQGTPAPRKMPAGIIGGPPATTLTRARLTGSASGSAGVSLLAKAPAPPSGTAQSPGVAVQPSTVIGFTGDGQSGKANAAAPGQVALSEGRPAPIQDGYAQINSGFYRAPNGAVIQGQAPTTGPAVAGRPLPGAPMVGADGSVQYDQAWADKNKSLLADYAQKNTMPFGVPAPGVAASMVTGGYTPSGGLTQTPRGFTREDRARQLEAMTDRGNAYRAGEAADYARTRGRMAIASGDMQRAEAIGKQAVVESGMQVAPPTASSQAMGTQRLARQKQAVDQGNEAAKLAMEQQSAALQDEQMQLTSQGMQRAQAQAQQEQGLMDQFLNGTPEQQATAGKKLAVLRNTKPGEPIKLKQSYDTGRIDFDKKPIMADYEILMSQDGKVLYDPMAQGAQQKRPVGQMQEQKTGKIYDVYADGTRQEVQQ